MDTATTPIAIYSQLFYRLFFRVACVRNLLEKKKTMCVRLCQN